LGVTTVYEGHNVTPDQIDVFREFRRADALSVRVLAAPQAEISSALTPWISPLTLEQFEGNLEQALRLVESHDDWLRVDGVTLNVAGPFWSGMLMMREPYLGPFGDPTTGERNIAIEKQRLAVQFCAERGLRFNMIQGGTAGHDESLDIYESVAAQSPALRRNNQDGNWVLQHGYPIEPDQISRFADLGFDFTISMSFPWGKGDVFRERAGPEILKHLNPLRTVIDAGISVGAGSDWGPKNIFEHIELAMTHRFCGSGYRNLGPAQTITREEAVAMWTRDAAKVLRWPGIGVLEPGAHADFIVVDRNPLSCAVEDLAGTGVLLTVVGGRAVYDTRAIAYGDWPNASRPSSPLSARGKWGLYDGCC
jgi:predicted amidohydrolase YtcJ